MRRHLPGEAPPAGCCPSARRPGRSPHWSRRDRRSPARSRRCRSSAPRLPRHAPRACSWRTRMWLDWRSAGTAHRRSAIPRRRDSRKLTPSTPCSFSARRTTSAHPSGSRRRQVPDAGWRIWRGSSVPRCWGARALDLTLSPQAHHGCAKCQETSPVTSAKMLDPGRTAALILCVGPAQPALMPEPGRLPLRVVAEVLPRIARALAA